MTTFLQLAFLLSIILLDANPVGLSERSLGSAIYARRAFVGIRLGLSVVDLLHFPFVDPAVGHTIAELGELDD